MNRHRLVSLRHSPRKDYSHTTLNDYLCTLGNRYNVGSVIDKSHALDGRRAVIQKQDPVLPVKPDFTVEDVQFNILHNTKEHHTHEYSICEKGQGLVVRRGQWFDITIELNKEFDPNQEDLKLVFLAGNNPTPTKGTRVSLILSDKDEAKDWGAWILKNEQKKLSVRITTPPKCYVGVWKLHIETIKKSDNINVIFEYTHDEDIYIIFNPWCKDDQVYLPDSSLLEEYILNDTGKIYMGNEKQICGKKWNFAQFEDNILDCAMYLLDTFVPSWAVRGDPVKMSRKLTALANCQDEGGILTGNWSGDYKGGTSPLQWVGSEAILKEYYKTKKPVCYGQCWVFSGVLTTLFRTLGIPARSVTNFGSAHDCDGSISIDYHWSEAGEPIEELNNDSIWNFHVWNDVWMARPDLPAGYGGWQAVDATPQEASDGIYQCGPAPLEAIRRGEVHLPYDTPFVFAEVNADKVNWEVNKSGEFTNIGVVKNCIGNRISTKIPKGKPPGKFELFCWDMEREDITNQYKYEEGSEEERTAVIRANQNSTKKGIYHQGKKSDVDFELLEKDTVPYGNDFEVILKLHNNSDEERTITGSVCVTSMYYTGVPAAKVKSLCINEEKIKGKSSKQLSLKVSFNEYYHTLVDQCHMKMSCMCKVKETDHTYVAQDAFRLIKPQLSIKTASKGKIGEKIKAEVSFTNPLSCALTNCGLTVEGPGLQNATVFPQSIVPSRQTFITTIEFLPFKDGLRELVLSFNSNELAMVDGACEIKITP